MRFPAANPERNQSRCQAKPASVSASIVKKSVAAIEPKWAFKKVTSQK